jgi:hypothetical protein
LDADCPNADPFVAIIFSAIALSVPGELRYIVGAADYVSRTPPTADEFERAIQTLLGMGLVEESGPLRFQLTPTRAELWMRTGEGGDIERYLRAAKLVPTGPSKPWTLNRDAFEAANADYRADFARTLDALGHGDD